MALWPPGGQSSPGQPPAQVGTSPPDPSGHRNPGFPTVGPGPGPNRRPPGDRPDIAPGAVHQGAALEAWPLKSRDLDDSLADPRTEQRRVVLVLDQLSDPQNVGA